MAAPLTVALKNIRSNRFMSLTGLIEQPHISTAAPGGFGTFTFQMAERAMRRLDFSLQSFYGCDVNVTDVGGVTLFEGMLTDVKLHSDATDAYFEIECTGWQILLDNPYRNVVITRNLSWAQENLAFSPAQIRPDLIPMTIGTLDATDATKIGVRIDFRTATALVASQRNGAQFLFPTGLRLDRIKFDYNVDISRTATFQVVGIGVVDSGAVGSSVVFINPGVGSGVIDSLTPFSTIARGMILGFECVTGGTSSAAMFAQIYNIRVLGIRQTGTGTSSQEPVYGHECVSDIVSQSPLLLDYSGISQDTSYQVQEFSYPTSVTGREALDAITAYFNKYWAVWENKKLFWKDWSPTSTADWVVSRDNGAQIDLDPSIVNAANVARVRYQNASGLATEVDISDTNQDNVYTLAGRTKTNIVDLGVVSTSTAATQVGAVYFPDHSYEVVGGTITLDARTQCFSQTYGNVQPAYKIRAGDSVRLRDGNSQRSIFDTTSWNRATLFRITATDLDWDGGIMKLTCDNSQAQLDQLLARIATNQSAKYGT